MINGNLNYLLFKLCKLRLEMLCTSYKNLKYLLFKLCELYIEEGESYNAYKNFIGELECARLEIKRRYNKFKLCRQFIKELQKIKLEMYTNFVAPYEDIKIKENGDVE